MKKCPYCAETIQDAAIVCPHCRRDLPVGGAGRQFPTRNIIIGIAVFVGIALLSMIAIVGVAWILRGGTQASPVSFTAVDTATPVSTPSPVPPTETPAPTAAPSASPTVVVLPIVWNGMYRQAGFTPSSISLVILKLEGENFTGNMIWRTGNYDATTKVNGRFVKDFGDSSEQAMWANHPDYASGQREGTWITWTETSFVEGWGLTLGGWYFGHFQDDGSITGIYYVGPELSTYQSGDSWTLKQQ